MQRRVTVNGVSLPASLAQTMFADAIAKNQNQKFKIDPTYKFLVEQFYNTPNEDLKKFYREEMAALREMHSDKETKEYLLWFENNLDKLTFKDFGKIELFTAAKAEIPQP